MLWVETEQEKRENANDNGMGAFLYVQGDL